MIMFIMTSKRWIDVEFNNGIIVKFQRTGNKAYVYRAQGDLTPIDSFWVGYDESGTRPSLLEFTEALGAYAQYKGYETTVNAPTPRVLRSADEYIAIAIACGGSDPAVARAEWEALQVDGMLSLIVSPIVAIPS
jgi:hypothetical protein